VRVSATATRSSSIRRFALLAAVATALSGCGGESGLSADELAQRANAICARYQPLYRTIINAHTGAAVVRYLDRTRPASLREERELGALRPRRHEAPKVQRLLDHVRAADRTLVQLRDAWATHDYPTGLKIGRRLKVEIRRTTKEARALGWTVCASDPR
jgi:hypothetical protein